MKVSNVLQNGVNTAVQNLQHPVENIRERSEVTKVNHEHAQPVQSERRRDGAGDARINIPANFKPLVGLTAKEQAFFEDLFPKARKEIRAYIDQQENVVHEKGQIIDAKG